MNDFENQSLNKINQTKRFIKFTSTFVLIVLLALSFILLYENYLSPEAKFQKQQKENYKKFQDWQAKYEKAMREDTYGGKTPEETLQLFIDALKKEDIDLAAKYFVLNTNGEQDPKWKEALLKAKESGKLNEIINLLSKSKPDLGAKISDNDYIFSTRNDRGEVLLDMGLEFNKHSGVWKINSLY